MKISRIAGVLLAVANLILLALCAALYFRADKTEPVIRFQESSLVFQEDTDPEQLLEGVWAYDEKDGDLTERIVIEKLIENRENNTVAVIYAVSDKAGNVAKSSREFPAIFPEEEKVSDAQADGLLEAGITAALKEDDSASFAAPSPSAEPSLTPTPSPEEVPTPTPEEMPSPEEVPASTPQEEAEPEPAAEADSPIPVLTLKVSEITVSAGQGPAWVDVIDTLKDDKDDYMTLFSNLQVSSYDKDQPGTYPVTVSTVDSDGNASEQVPLTIFVE